MQFFWSTSPRLFLIPLLLLTATALPDKSMAAPQLMLSWTNTSPLADGIKIERKTGTSGTFTQIVTVAANVTSYTDTTISSSTTYCYRLRAYTTAEDSAYSNESCGTAQTQAVSLTVGKIGVGSGTVTSAPTGIACGATCSASYTNGTAVTLTATPASGSIFSGWSGGRCSGTGNCVVTLNTNTSVTATFATTPQPSVPATPQTSTLTVTKVGSGSVSSTPTGLTCGTTCSASYTNGTAVTLTATPASGSIFSGWSGGRCSGTGNCVVTLNTNTSVMATFTSHLNAKIGVFRRSTGKWYLDLNGNGMLDDCTADGCLQPFGQQNNALRISRFARPLVGDWTGTGTAKIGIFDPSSGFWKFDRNGNARWDGCTVDLCFGPMWSFTDLPAVGHWTRGSSTDTIGIYRPSTGMWWVDYNGNGRRDACTVDGCGGPFGKSTDLPLAGDWTGAGVTEIGVFDPSTRMWKLDSNGNGKFDGCSMDSCLGPFGIAGDLPVVGDWDGTRKSKIGVFDPSTGIWELDLNGNGRFDGCKVDSCLGPFGQQGDLPVVGKW